MSNPQPVPESVYFQAPVLLEPPTSATGPSPPKFSSQPPVGPRSLDVGIAVSAPVGAPLDKGKGRASDTHPMLAQPPLDPQPTSTGFANNVPAQCENAPPGGGAVTLTIPRPAWLPSSEPLFELPTGQIVPIVWLHRARLPRGEIVPAELESMEEKLFPTYEKSLEIDKNQKLGSPLVLERRESFVQRQQQYRQNLAGQTVRKLEVEYNDWLDCVDDGWLPVEDRSTKDSRLRGRIARDKALYKSWPLNVVGSD